MFIVKIIFIKLQREREREKEREWHNALIFGFIISFADGNPLQILQLIFYTSRAMFILFIIFFSLQYIFPLRKSFESQRPAVANGG